MKLTAMTAAHLPLLPLTWWGGRDARSVHAQVASDTWMSGSGVLIDRRGEP